MRGSALKLIYDVPNNQVKKVTFKPSFKRLFLNTDVLQNLQESSNWSKNGNLSTLVGLFEIILYAYTNDGV